MLTNITTEVTQRTNRYSPTNGATGACEPHNAYAAYYGEVAIPQTFTPYAPAGSIQRFQPPHSLSRVASGTQNLSTRRASEEPNAIHTPMHVSTTRPSVPPTVLPMSSPTAPVYGPSTVSPYQLFVDVVSGASLSIDDAYVHYGMPNVTVGNYSSGSPHSPYGRSTLGYDGNELLCPSSVDLVPTIETHNSYASSVAIPAQNELKVVVPEPQPEPVMIARRLSAPTEVTVGETPKSVVPHIHGVLAQPSTYSVTIRGHHNRNQTVISHVPLEEGAYVVFEGDRGLDMGIVAGMQQSTKATATNSSTPMVVRNATEEEITEWTDELPRLAAEATEECAAVVESMRLKMVVRGASYQLDRQKLTFFYETSEHRVDFRKLLIELFGRYRCRIWMEKYRGEESVARHRSQY